MKNWVFRFKGTGISDLSSVALYAAQLCYVNMPSNAQILTEMYMRFRRQRFRPYKMNADISVPDLDFVACKFVTRIDSNAPKSPKTVAPTIFMLVEKHFN